MTYDPDLAREETTELWDRRRGNLNLPDVSLEWAAPITVDGGYPLISAQVVGPQPADALLGFIRLHQIPEYQLRSEEGPCQQPTLDDTVPGRTALVWRIGGVWVELWHTDRPAPAPVPVEPTSTAVAATHIPAPRPSARLPFARLRKALNLTKEKSA